MHIFPAHRKTYEELLIVWIQLQNQPATLHDLFQHLTPLQSVFTILPAFLIHAVCQQGFHWYGSLGSYMAAPEEATKENINQDNDPQNK